MSISLTTCLNILISLFSGKQILYKKNNNKKNMPPIKKPK